MIDSKEGEKLDPAYDFEDYRDKANRHINEHGNTLAIYKLTHNIPLGVGDYSELERVLTSELGSREDYAREFGDTPFGSLVRKSAAGIMTQLCRRSRLHQRFLTESEADCLCPQGHRLRRAEWLYGKCDRSAQAALR